VSRTPGVLSPFSVTPTIEPTSEPAPVPGSTVVKASTARVARPPHGVGSRTTRALTPDRVRPRVPGRGEGAEHEPGQCPHLQYEEAGPEGCDDGAGGRPDHGFGTTTPATRVTA
jgi:hypothetical protein